MKKSSVLIAKEMQATIATAMIILSSAFPASSEELGMAKTARSKAQPDAPKGWIYAATRLNDYAATIDLTEKHSGTRCATLKSVVAEPKPFGNLMQYISAKNYAGKRLRMSAWVKTKVETGSAQLWVRIDGDWESSSSEAGCFDNMDDRPITGTTDWKKYDLVVQLPVRSTGIAFGLMLIGKGQVWLDDVNIEEVGPEVPLTGSFSKGSKYPTTPTNLNFEDSD
jgi:hypothetical protein